ncbi:hypothetical protein NDU88_001033 [Pleurodeles waltl]|uniref:Uncharacterized protein n=1 Tax=Pleurodeles waltl TaxID=8319 RepID=A0AAV7P2R5_PLEWA|nr:hypothetical protein NDU88_001033 [Pleurodeles waltl]
MRSGTGAHPPETPTKPWLLMYFTTLPAAKGVIFYVGTQARGPLSSPLSTFPSTDATVGSGCDAHFLKASSLGDGEKAIIRALSIECVLPVKSPIIKHCPLQRGAVRAQRSHSSHPLKDPI